MSKSNPEIATEYEELIESDPQIAFDTLESKEKVVPREVKQILNSVDNIIRTRLRFAPKDNEGMQALIFKLDVEA